MKKIWMMLALMLLIVALLTACTETPDTPVDPGNDTPGVTDTDTDAQPGGEEKPPLNISGNSQAKDDREENRHEPDASLNFQKTGTASDIMQADFATPDAP